MKKFWKYIAACAVVASMMPLAACDDDDTVDPYDINYCYLYQPNSTFAQVEYKANGEFLIDINDPLKLMPVRLTKPAPKNLNIEVAIDPTLVDEYNQEHGTSYVLLEGASITNPTMHIEAGKYISPDSITVSFGDRSGFQTGDPDLILPVVIRSADGMTISKSSRIFLTFSSTYRANMLTPTSKLVISNDTEVDGWETANTNYTITDFLTAQWEADDQITVKAEIDNSLVAGFNQENSTEFKTMQASLKNSNLVIAKGNKTVDLGLTLGNYTGVANGEEYLIPIKLSITDGKGAELRTDVVYVQVTQLPLEITADYGTVPSGLTQISPEANWAAVSHTVNYGDEDCSYILQSASRYYGVETGDLMEIDLGSEKTVDMFAIQFYAWYYALSEIESVQTSVDGNSWTDWGTVELGDEATWNLTFSKPAKFRYIRFIAGGYAYSDDYGCYIRQIRFYSK